MFCNLYSLPIFAIPITTKTKNMHTVSLTNANAGNQIVKINRTAVVFAPEFTEKIGKMKSKRLLTSEDMPTIGKFTIIALGKGRYAVKYVKNYLSVTAAVLIIKDNRILEIQAR